MGNDGVAADFQPKCLLSQDGFVQHSDGQSPLPLDTGLDQGKASQSVVPTYFGVQLPPLDEWRKSFL